MKAKLFIIAVLFTFFLCCICGCSGKPDASGIWKGKAVFTDTDLWTKKVKKGNDTIELMLAQSDKNINGKITVNNQAIQIDSGFIIDNKISLKAGPINIEATINGSNLDGTIKSEYRGEYGIGSVHKLEGTLKLTK